MGGRGEPVPTSALSILCYRYRSTTINAGYRKLNTEAGQFDGIIGAKHVNSPQVADAALNLNGLIQNSKHNMFYQ